MAVLELRSEGQREAAARRFAERLEARRRQIAILEQPGGLAAADTPERVAKRVRRLSRYYADAELLAAPEAGLEKIINTVDLVGVRYLEAGVAAGRAVGRVDIRHDGGRVVGYGTGSLVSPRLLLTNHHVLPDADTARTSAIELNYQDGVDGQPLQPVLFALDPGAFFLADEERDFAIVAVTASEPALAAFGFNRMIEAEGKAIIGEFVTIVQHPRGEKKQVALRENRIVDVADAFLHYEADTEPGSSGSPVFNDQWEVVALHHASVPAPDHAELGGFMNEGIRISRILKFVHEADLPVQARALADQLFASERIVVATAPSGVAATGSPGTEAITIDPDYADRHGYDAEFLGEGDHRVPLPVLPAELIEKTATNSQATTDPRYLLPYHHFSVVMNRERALAFFTAVNIDGTLSLRLRRERDHWFLDPRVATGEQTGETVYADNPLDRGHLVRRLDPAWATSRAVAKYANDDTFHFTNCTPQHRDFNQSQTTWAGLEDYILENAENHDLKVSVFTGPVFAEDDDIYRDVRLPRQFWKVVAMVREDGGLSATGYLLSQEKLLHDLELTAAAPFSYGEYRTFQVPVSRIEDLTALSFGALDDADPLGRVETTASVRPRPIDSARDLVL